MEREMEDDDSLFNVSDVLSNVGYLYAVAAVLAVIMFIKMFREGKKNRQEGQLWMAEKAKVKGIQRLPSGLLFHILKKGTGARSPMMDSPCKVHYEGRLKDGSKFDSSYDRGEPTTFAPNQVIKGWTEALQLMKEGDIWEVIIPYELGYGAAGAGSIPSYAPLVFKMELIQVADTKRSAADAIAELEKLTGKKYSEL